MKDPSAWRLLLFGTIAILLLCALDALLESDGLLYFFIVIPGLGLLSLMALILAAISSKRRHYVPVALTMVVIFGLLSFLFLKHHFGIRNAERWLLWSRHYKSELLNQPEPPGQELRHIEWDGWGFAGVGDKTVYLVFDPGDSLAGAAKNHSAGKFPGIPCTVPEINKLEKHWYAVMFYTDESWGKPHTDCGLND